MASTYRVFQALTVTAAQVSAGPHTNFPVLVSITSNSLKTKANGGQVYNASGFDIVFSMVPKASNPVRLNWEVESYNGTTGTLVAWVQIASLSTSTVFYMIYGNPGISTFQGNVASTWDATFQAVFHLSGSAASSFTQSATASGVGNAIHQAGGFPAAQTNLINGGQNVTVACDYETAAITPWAPFPQTFSVWINAGSFASGGADLLSLVNCSRMGVAESGGNLFVYYVRDVIAGINFPTTTQPKNAWTFFAVTVDATGNALIGYSSPVGGTLKTEAQAGGSLNPFTGVIALPAKRSDFFTFVGLIDEARICKVARSAGWLQTVVNNQGQPTVFLTAGSLRRFASGGGGTFRNFFDPSADFSKDLI